MSAPSSKGSRKGSAYAQYFVNQTPRYDNQVGVKRGKIIRPDKRKRKVRYL